MDKTEWLMTRKKGIGSSDAAAVLGLSPYRTPLQVWEEKRSNLINDFDNDVMFWGRCLEPVIRQRYSDVTGNEVLLPTEILKHPKFEYMMANLDGFTKEPRVVEIKTSSKPQEWGDEFTDAVPMAYLIQVQHQMIITEFPVADIPVLFNGRDFRIYTVEADTELQTMIIEKEAEFWKLVETGEPPAPVNYQDVVRLYRKSEAKEVMATAEVEQWVEGLRKIRADLKTLEDNETELKRRIMEALGEADTLTDPAGKVLATWRQSKPTKRFDMEAFKNLFKETYKEFLVESEGSRRFLIKERKAE